MDTRKWPWKKRSSERSGGESESSESISSHSERFSDEQESMKETGNDSTRYAEVTSHITVSDDEVKESMKSLAEKLSAALVNVSAKEDLVKQHAKVAEEAVAGWEKAENEVTALKQQLEAAVQQNLSLEVKNSHLDGALKECVRQLRQARDEQEKRASDGVVERNREWETKRAELEKQILDLEKENSLLKQELVSCYKELEVVRVERDLSTKSAETASKLQLDSIKKVAKLEAECRKLQSQARKSPPLSNHKSLPGESLRSESGERVNSIISTDLDSCRASSTDVDSWASTLISEIDQFKSEKPSTKSLANNSLQIDMMDDFLEMERLVSLPEAKPNTPLAPLHCNPLKPESKSELDSMTKRVAHLETMLDKTEEQNSQLQNVLEATVDSLKAAHRRLEDVEIELNEAYKAKESLEFHLNAMEVESRTLSSIIDSLKAEIEEERKLSAASSRLEELQNELNEANKAKESLSFQLNTMEDESRSFSSTINSLKAEIEEERKSSAAESVELHNALDHSLDSLKAAHTKIEEMQTELTEAYKSKESFESQLITMEAESRTLSSNLNALKKEIEEERKLSAELKKKYEELENEILEYEVQQSIHSNSEVKFKQEDLAMAADKLAECQQTIASLGRQLESLATLEDFFIDPSSIPGLAPDTGGEIWRLPSNGGACVSNGESYSILANGNTGSSSSSTNHVTTAKKWNSFPELFNGVRVIEHENG